MIGEQAAGGRHPITDGADRAWALGEDLFAWMQPGHAGDGKPEVVIQGRDGDVTIPARLVPKLMRALAAAHVDGGRKDRWPT